MPKFTRSPRGTRDIVGVDAEVFEYLTDTFRRIARLNGFRPIITPTIEFFELFSRKSGEEILGSMYVFEDKAGRLLALRPEVTASIVRAYLKNLLGEPKPILLYYIAQCFRYEEPQRGRYREFWQLGLEVIGERDKLNSDLRVAYTLSEYLSSVGVKHWFIVGNVGVYRVVMESLDIDPKDQDHVLHLIDKREIDNAYRFIEEKYGIDVADKVIGITRRSLSDLAEYIEEIRDTLRGRTEEILSLIGDTERFIGYLNSIGIEATYDPALVRGLAYYTGLIYEIKAYGLDISIGGGGRYDDLTVVYGGPQEYLTGAALGLDRIMLVSSFNIVSGREVYRVAVVLFKKDLESYRYAYKIVSALHSINVEASIYTGKASKTITLALRKGYTHIVFIGDREVKEKVVTVKDLATGKQVVVEYSRLLDLFSPA